LRNYFDWLKVKHEEATREDIRGYLVQMAESGLVSAAYCNQARAAIRKRATFHTLWHSFATHPLEDGVDIRYIQEFMGHGSVRTTERYTHVTQEGVERILSPLDRFDPEPESPSRKPDQNADTLNKLAGSGKNR
jgi:site-specific recombinase XerD